MQDTGRVRMNAVGRLVLNNPARALAQRRYVLPRLAVLGGRLDGCRVFEVGCGRGVETMLLFDLLGAASIDAIDVDPHMVHRATKRLDGRAGTGAPAAVAVGDMKDSGARSCAYDAVVDLGALHLEPEWRVALGEIHRVLVPGGRFFFEEIVGPVHQRLVPIATGKRIAGGITRATLLHELEDLGFDIVGITDPRSVRLTGMVGDILGVARKR
jgi:SAM-dependent methyltransferase